MRSRTFRGRNITEVPESTYAKLALRIRSPALRSFMRRRFCVLRCAGASSLFFRCNFQFFRKRSVTPSA